MKPQHRHQQPRARQPIQPQPLPAEIPPPDPQDHPALDQAAASEAQDSDDLGDRDLIDRMVEYLRDLLDADVLEQVRADLRAEFAGESLYIPRVGQTERQQRVTRVLRLFDGRNATEVARRLGISRATVYRVLRQAGR